MLTTAQDKSCAYCGTTFGKPVDLSYNNPPQPKPAPQAQPQSNNYQQQNQQYQQKQPGYTAPPYIQAQPPVYNNNQQYNRYQQRNIPTTSSQSSWLVTLLLCLFVGYLGVHRFYTKNWLVGIIQLFTGGGCGIWWLIDLILIVAGSYRDGDGQPLVKDV
ncbi:MAG: TM2 domain-containing protein [Bacteroidales bacterium]|nr:TM2 domain-containing protein [Bacteroidales bacterium]